MRGQWFDLPRTRRWSLVNNHQEASSISGDALRELCQQTGLSTAEALSWLVTRPQAPHPAAAGIRFKSGGCAGKCLVATRTEGRCESA